VLAPGFPGICRFDSCLLLFDHLHEVRKVINNFLDMQTNTLVECEGSCEVHKGVVMPVKVSGNGFDLSFNYCQAAISEDERRGFVVTVITKEGDGI